MIGEVLTIEDDEWRWMTPIIGEFDWDCYDGKSFGQPTQWTSLPSDPPTFSELLRNEGGGGVNFFDHTVIEQGSTGAMTLQANKFKTDKK